MPGLALFLALIAPDPFPATLPDAHAFGVTREIARINRDATQRHRAEVVDRFAADECRWAWQARQEAVWCAWAFLTDALDEGAPTPVRLRNLENLKYRIGAGAYAAGWMPSPVPDYQPSRPWQK